jgi:hypothetical protein
MAAAEDESSDERGCGQAADGQRTMSGGEVNGHGQTPVL